MPVLVPLLLFLPCQLMPVYVLIESLCSHVLLARGPFCLR